MRNYQSDETVLAAFRQNWERLGEVARRLSCGHGNLIITQARTLHKAGAVEQRMWLGHLQWRRAARWRSQTPTPKGRTLMAEKERDMLAKLDHPAVLSSLKMLRARYSGKRCDSEAVADCVNCNTMFLVNTIERLRGNEG